MAKRRFLKKAAFGAGVGAALMYFFDPDNGSRRRARFTSQTTPGDVSPTATSPSLRQTIESQVLRYYPKGSVDVEVDRGVVVLRGRLPRAEQITALIDDVAQVDGVQDVRSFLQLEGASAN